MTNILCMDNIVCMQLNESKVNVVQNVHEEKIEYRFPTAQ